MLQRDLTTIPQSFTNQGYILKLQYFILTVRHMTNIPHMLPSAVACWHRTAPCKQWHHSSFQKAPERALCILMWWDGFLQVRSLQAIEPWYHCHQSSLAFSQTSTGMISKAEIKPRLLHSLWQHESLLCKTIFSPLHWVSAINFSSIPPTAIFFYASEQHPSISEYASRFSLQWEEKATENVQDMLCLLL